ncbi:hypothetical protein PI124_g8111 [Phytophthora idaei]|nr:hypothetical protein PI125_g12197 [Phytophthora idaei]KAG3155397.1 hypothetical protein PI126_g9182 [Phytophthora idaei]KAG3247199.1 hypothetical protein PI124_g8111 [Phytophthora idaei]
MRYWYIYPEQLLFVDETSKNGLDCARRYLWAKRGERAIVRTPFARGERVSTLAACGFAYNSWHIYKAGFHRAFVETVLPRLNAWPLPRSIVVMENACIQMYPELEDAVHSGGAVLLFLPPYCPQFNPIEVRFGQLKRWLSRHANLAFPLYPEKVLNVAMIECMKREEIGINPFRHCGYADSGLRDEVFEQDLYV